MKAKLFFVAAIALTAIINNQKLKAQSWLLNGNSNAAGSSKLGTLNNVPLKIYTNDSERVRITNNGNVGIGTNAPTEALQVAGNILSTDSVAGNVAFFPVISFTKNTNGAGLKNVGGDLYVHGLMPATSSGTTPGNVFLSAPAPGGVPVRTGRVGIGTTTPQQRLSVDSGMTVDQSSSNTGVLYPGLVLGNASGEGIASNRHPGFNQYGLNFYTNYTARMSITNPGRVGIGTGTPQQMLSVDSGMNIDQANINTGALTPGLTFGSGSGEGIASKRKPGGDQYDLNFYTDFIARISIDNSGKVGVGLNPLNSSAVFNDARLQIISDSDDNIRLIAQDNSNDWSMFTQPGTSGVLALYHKGNLRGSFDATTGAYSSVSDERLKTDITPLPGVMEKLMKLQPKEYHFKSNAAAKNYSYGFIAQDVNKIFPEFVTAVNDRKTGSDILTLNYNNFSVIAIKAIQELSSQNDSLKQSNQALNDKLNALSNKIDQIENAMSQCCNSFSSAMQSMDQSASKIPGARLDQNIPNPFDNSSSISYYIPSGYHNAQLMITDASGKTLKTYSITQSGLGKQIISGSELTSGMYRYSLLVDGKLVDSKKMVLSK
jgi:hypothetical protein